MEDRVGLLSGDQVVSGLHPLNNRPPSNRCQSDLSPKRLLASPSVSNMVAVGARGGFTTEPEEMGQEPQGIFMLWLDLHDDLITPKVRFSNKG